MKCIVSLDHRFLQGPDGRVYSTIFGHRFWQRYLDVFESVTVVARLRPVDEVGEDWHEATGPGVSFAPMPFYLGPKEFFLKLPKLIRSIKNAIDTDSAIILRAHFNISSIIYHHIKKTGRPVAVEVVGNPSDSMSPGVIRHPIRPIARAYATWDLSNMCRNAAASLYVTEEALQLAFPPSPSAPSYGISDVELYDDCYVDQPFAASHFKGRLRFICVGMFETLVKAHDIQIQALAKAVKAGHDIELAFIGDGRSRDLLDGLAKENQVVDRVHFLGRRNAGAEVREELDKSHVFLLPSRQEGLPRAMVEAMARGLPAIGSEVGGMYELIGRENLVKPGDSEGLSEMMAKFASSPDFMAECSRKNLERSRDYHDVVLSKSRTQFYKDVLRVNEAYQAQRTK